MSPTNERFTSRGEGKEKSDPIKTSRRVSLQKGSVTCRAMRILAALHVASLAWPRDLKNYQYLRPSDGLCTCLDCLLLSWDTNDEMNKNALTTLWNKTKEKQTE